MSFEHTAGAACVADPTACLWQALGARLRRMTGPWLQSKRAQVTSDALHALDDHLLFDIGLTRTELQSWAVAANQADRRSA